jgi:LytS/YehU family sensor histidine kinase
VGLANIRARLAALYGERAALRLEANAPRGVVATISIPVGT